MCAEFIRHLERRKLDYFEQYEEQFNNLIRKTNEELGSGILKISRDIAELILREFDQDFNITVKLVLDTNILLREVINTLKGKPGFLSDFLDSALFEIYGPNYLAHEIHEKIDIRIDEHKRKHAHSIADRWLDRIQIIEPSVESMESRALEKLRRRDPKDIPFLAVALQINSHGILTGDMDFDEQSEVSVFRLGHARLVWYELSRGSISICALGGTAIALELSSRALLLILQSIFQLTKSILYILLAIFEGVWQLLLKVPSWVYILIGLLSGISAILLVFSPELRHLLWSKLEPSISSLRNKMKRGRQLLWKFPEGLVSYLDSIAPYLETLAMAYGYFLYCSIGLVQKIDKLESGSGFQI